MARKVGKKSGKRPRKPPLHVVSDFGSTKNSMLKKRVGRDKKLPKAKGGFHVK
jgi:hypothetical protein